MSYRMTKQPLSYYLKSVSLKVLDEALTLELEVKLVADPSATHLNICRLDEGLMH